MAAGPVRGRGTAHILLLRQLKHLFKRHKRVVLAQLVLFPRPLRSHCDSENNVTKRMPKQATVVLSFTLPRRPSERSLLCRQLGEIDIALEHSYGVSQVAAEAKRAHAPSDCPSILRSAECFACTGLQLVIFCCN